MADKKIVQEKIKQWDKETKSAVFETLDEDEDIKSIKEQRRISEEKRIADEKVAADKLEKKKDNDDWFLFK